MGISILLPNNTLLLALPESKDSWGFATFDIIKYKEDYGYSNVHIIEANPRINSRILTSSSTDISIKYDESVTLSTGNISVFLVDESGTGKLRQIVNAGNSKHCRLSEDGLTVNVTVIKSTFSKPETQYYIKIYNNFVKNQLYGEPLLGIPDNIWYFTSK